MSALDPPVSPSEQARPSPTVSVRRSRLVLVFLCAAGFMTFLDVSIVNVALPTIESELDIPQHQLPYVVTAYGMVLGGFLLLCGRLADHFGRRRMLRVGLLLFAATSLAAGTASSAATLVAARGAQGLGAAFIATAALGLLTNAFPEGPQRKKALGAWGALSGIAAVAGVVLGGLLTDGPGWRWVFFVNVPIGLVGALVAPLIVAESRAGGRRRPFDVPGAALLTAGLTLLIFALGESTGETGGRWLSVEVLASLGGAAALLLAFALNERRAASPLVPFGIFTSRPVLAANVVAVLLLGTVVSLFFFASLFLQQVLDYSPVRAGLAYVPLAVTTAVGAGIGSVLVARTAARTVLLPGLLLAAGALLLLWRMPADAFYPVDVLPAFVLLGCGLGLSFVPVQVAAFTGVEQTEHGGVAAGIINTSQEAGGALGLAVVSTIAFRRVAELTAWAGGDSELVREARASVFREGFLVGSGFLVVAVLVALLLLPALRPASKSADGLEARREN